MSEHDKPSSDNYFVSAPSFFREYVEKKFEESNGGKLYKPDSGLRERIAELCHKQWSGWMLYLFSKCEKGINGELIIPKWAVDRWCRQISTEYVDLSETEKDSDRKEADIFIELIKAV